MKRSIVRHVLRLLEDLSIIPVCEGVETPDELSAVVDLGSRHIQEYLLARPAFESLAIVKGLPSLTEQQHRAAEA